MKLKQRIQQRWNEIENRSSTTISSRSTTAELGLSLARRSSLSVVDLCWWNCQVRKLCAACARHRLGRESGEVRQWKHRQKHSVDCGLYRDFNTHFSIRKLELCVLSICHKLSRLCERKKGFLIKRFWWWLSLIEKDIGNFNRHDVWLARQHS